MITKIAFYVTVLILLGAPWWVFAGLFILAALEAKV